MIPYNPNMGRPHLTVEGEVTVGVGSFASEAGLAVDWEEPESCHHLHQDRIIDSRVNWQGQLLCWGRYRGQM